MAPPHRLRAAGDFGYYRRSWRTFAQPCGRGSTRPSEAPRSSPRRPTSPPTSPTGAAATTVARRPSCVPAARSEVAAVVRACAEARVPIVAQGGNTGQCGGATPDASGDAVVVSLARMNRVRAVDADNATLTVEAGATLVAVQEAATAAGLQFPLSLAAEGSCTIGGNLSTNAGGTAVLRFGNARELTLGIEVVLADGRIWDGLRGLRKDNTGYDLKQLFIGAEGTLGIVTAAVLKLFPAPRTRATAFAALARRPRGDRAPACAAAGARRPADRLRAHLAAFARAHAAALSRRCPTRCPGIPGTRSCRPTTVPRTRRSRPISSGRSASARARDGARCRRRAVGRAGERALGAAREHRRSAAPRRAEHQARHLAAGVGDSGVPRSGPRSELVAALPGLRFVTFGHLGDGNLHYNLAAPAGVPAEAFLAQTAAANRIVHDLVARTAAASAPSTASGSRSGTSSSATEARSSSISCARSSARSTRRRFSIPARCSRESAHGQGHLLDSRSCS